MKKIILASMLAFTIITGCSDSDFQMIQAVGQGEVVKLEKGDSINKNSENTRVVIRHTLGTDEKELEVLSGSVTLIKGNYSQD